MAWALALPARRKNEPGILPAAYIRSSMSTVRGKKSTPSRGVLLAVAVTSTTVLPSCPTTAPLARLPISNDSVLPVPPTGPDTEIASAIPAPCWFWPPSQAGRQIGEATEPVPSCQPPGCDRGAGDWQLTSAATDRLLSDVKRAARGPLESATGAARGGR